MSSNSAKLAFFIGLVQLTCQAAEAPKTRPPAAIVVERSESFYYWKATPVGDSAQLLTLFCRDCESSSRKEPGLPVISVLRDTLGDNDPANDRLTYVWLLSFARLNAGQKILSGVPFFYWRVGEGSTSVSPRDTSPLMNLSAPERPVLSSIGRDLVQWTTLDPMAMPVRAVSRSYRSNEIDNERLYISEAIRFLQQAPAAQSNNDDPTRAQLQMLIARLELREQLLGGFVTAKNLSHFGEQSALEHEKIRSRNWELLRQCAERTGLYFEPLDIGAGTDEYGVLWFPNDSARPAAGVSSASVWKILNIRDPWADPRIRTWRGLTVTRPVDSYGSMLSPDAKGTRQVQLIPLGVYSLSYPKLPLLLIDFRDQLHVRRHEMTQRSINEIAAGIIGISHFTNWYYYVGLDLYEFIASRHGSATDQAARLDCYAAFRSDLLLDHNLPGELRRELEARVNSLSINPMGAALARDFEVAQTRYEVLQANSEQGGRLTQRLEKDRRAELARYSESPKGNLMNAGLHTASLGIYTHRRSSPQTTLAELDRYRRAEAQINFLESVASSGTAPEVAYESTRIQASISELRSLMPEISSRPMLSRASSSLERIKQISRDSGIQSECTSGLIELAQDNRKTTPVSAPPPIVTAPAGEMTTDLTIRSGLDASRAVSAFK